MATKKELRKEINRQRHLLSETMEEADFSRGPLRDTLRVVVPAMQNMLDLMEQVVNFSEGENSGDGSPKNQS